MRFACGKYYGLFEKRQSANLTVFVHSAVFKQTAVFYRKTIQGGIHYVTRSQLQIIQ